MASSSNVSPLSLLRSTTKLHRRQGSISGPGEGSRRTETAYLDAINSARHRIDLANAYFIPEDSLRDALVAAARRGVRVRIIAPAINDARFGRVAARSRFRALLIGGIELYLYHAAMYHAKTMAVDDARVIVGSANCDHRSFRLNDEASLNVYDRAFAERMTVMFEQDLKPTKRFTYESWKRRPLKEKLKERFLLPLRSQL